MNEELEQIAKDVVDASMKLHMALGPGLLESVYTVILQKKLQERGYQVKREVPIPVEYEGIQFELGFRADLVINDLKVTDTRLGLLINFGEAFLKDGIRRIAN